MRTKRKTIYIMCGILAYILLLFLLALAETASGGNSIDTVFDAFWYSVVTFSTVGYGDMFPVSVLGKVIGFSFIIISVGFFGLFIGKIASIIQTRSEKRRLGYMGINFTGHIIIVGWDSLSEDVAHQLVHAEKKIAILTDRKDDVDKIYQVFSQDDVFVRFCDTNHYENLSDVNVEQSEALFINLGTDTDKLVSIINIRNVYPNASIIVTLDNQKLKDTFVNAGVTYVLSKDEIASKLMASYIFEPAVADFTKDLMASTNNEEQYDIQQYKVTRDNPFLGRSYGEMFLDLKNKYNIIAIGLQKATGPKRKLIKAPGDTEAIEFGDYVLVILNGATEKVMQTVFNTKEGL